MRFSGLHKNLKKISLGRTAVTNNNTHYELRAIINHDGHSVNSGHYTALLKIAPGVRWYKCDDHVVERTTVLRTSPLAYILVYTRET